MVRDWSKPAYNQEADRWSASIELAKDVKPVYARYNGTTWAQLPGVPVRLQADGTVGMMLPQGSRSDPKARIYPFKLHRGVMPVLEGKGFLVSIVVEEFFADGDIDKPVKKAAEEMYGVKDARYRWVKNHPLHGHLPRGGARGESTGLLGLPQPQGEAGLEGPGPGPGPDPPPHPRSSLQLANEVRTRLRLAGACSPRPAAIPSRWPAPWPLPPATGVPLALLKARGFLAGPPRRPAAGPKPPRDGQEGSPRRDRRAAGFARKSPAAPRPAPWLARSSRWPAPPP
jgi:hypothetical protein